MFSNRGGGAMSFDPALNQFLSAAPMRPEIISKEDWPKFVAPRKIISAADRECIIRANESIAKAVEMGKRVYEKACQDHSSFTRIIKSGATALTGARRAKAKAEADLKKSKATVAAAPDCAILKIEKAHADEKVQELTKTKATNEKKIDKLEKSGRSSGRDQSYRRASSRSRTPCHRSSERDRSRRSRSLGRRSGRSRRSSSRSGSPRDRSSGGRSHQESSRSASYRGKTDHSRWPSYPLGSPDPKRSRHDRIERSTSRDRSSLLSSPRHSALGDRFQSPHSQISAPAIPTGNLDPARPGRDEVLDRLEESGRSFSNG